MTKKLKIGTERNGRTLNSMTLITIVILINVTEKSHKSKLPIVTLCPQVPFVCFYIAHYNVGNITCAETTCPLVWEADINF